MMLVPDHGALPRPHDPVAADRWFDRWLNPADPLDREMAQCSKNDGSTSALLAAIFGNSPYLSQTLIREQRFFPDLACLGYDAGLQHVIETVRAESAAETDAARLMAQLRVAKRRAALVIALADIAGARGLEWVTGALSDFADAAIDIAAHHVVRRAVASGTIEVPDPARPMAGSGLVVLGLGKLGARELNYSSDIDIIIFYDDSMVRSAKPFDIPRTFVRMARELVRILDERTADGYVFRTDLRLRPDPGATPLAVSLSAAESYYASVGQNWERAAMIRARPIAGDPEACENALAFLKPFIWRRNLDFAAIQDIHSIKRQINAHKGHRQIAVNGHDVKVGRGGIREIEFFAQTQQLIFGGRDPGLRTAGTFDTLHALVAAGHVDPETAKHLSNAYRFLRRVEHRIQMVDDQQTHRIPASDEGVAALACFLGYADPANFRRELLDQLGLVEDYYAELFEEATPLSAPGNLVFTGTDPDPDTAATLMSLGYTNPDAAITTVATWHRGRYRATRSGRARELLTELVPALLQALARTPQPDTALTRFDGFLGRLPAGVQLFSLFYANPWLLGLVADVMGAAPPLADGLARHPELLDAVLEPDFFSSTLPCRNDLECSLSRRLADARNFEDVILMLRRWTNEHRFRAGTHMLRGVTDADRCGPYLSDVASVALRALLDWVEQEFIDKHGRFTGAELAILALGKLGGRQMSIGSDLDLIVVYHVPDGQTQSDGSRPLSPSEYYTRMVKRLITALTAQTNEGRLYEVDMRLRPSGAAGPIAVSLEAFRRYHAEQSWTWEHMALCRARPISGSGSFCGLLESEIRTVLTRPRDPEQLLRAVFHMRERVDKEFGTTNPWSVKYARGGIMDINFMTQYWLLRYAHDHPAILHRNTVHALAAIREHGLVESGVIDTLIAGQRLWRRIQGILRLCTEKGVIESGTIPAGLLPNLACAVNPSVYPLDGSTGPKFTDLEEEVCAVAARTYAHYQAVIEVPASALPPLAEDGSVLK